MKTLLLDIDYTIMDGNHPRPHLKSFIERIRQTHRIVFYTAGTHLRVADCLRVMRHQLGIDDINFIRQLQRSALCRENCPMVKVGGVEIKCFDKASLMLNVPVEDLILLDDNPSYDHPHTKQVIQAKGWMYDYAGDNDDYLLHLVIPE